MASTRRNDQLDNPVLRRFRRKFVIITMVFVAVVLVAIVSAVCFWNYNQQVGTVYDALQNSLIVAKNHGEENIMRVDPFAVSAGDGPDVRQDDSGQGSAGQAGPREEGSNAESDSVAGQIDSESDANSDAEDPDKTSNESGLEKQNVESGGVDSEADRLDSEEEGLSDEGKGENPLMRSSSEDPFVASSTYIVNEDGEVSVVNDSLSLDSDVAEQAISVAMESMDASNPQRVQGSVSSLNLYYAADYGETGQITVSLASDNFVRHSTYSMLKLLVAMSLALLALLFVMSVMLSRWVVRPIAKAWIQQSQFIADASHELKTPLTVILANNSLLASDQDASEQEKHRWIESIDSEAHLMQGLVNDMLYLAQSDANAVSMECGEFDLSEMAMATALQFEAVAFESGVMIDEQIEEGILVRGDQARVQRMLAVLVDNACKYADAGTEIRVLMKRGLHECILEVCNFGTVIDPEDLPHLFDRFYRSDKARNRGTGGFGLGLAIAKSIVDDLDGDISVTSTQEAGTCFRVKIPLEK